MAFTSKHAILIKTYWEKLGKNYLKNRKGVRIEGPHIIIAELISELEENWGNNPKNIHYFQTALRNYCRSEIKNFLPETTTFNTLVRQLHEFRDRPEFIIHTAKKLLAKFESGEYFLNILAHLLRTIEEPSKNSELDFLHLLVEQLFVELILKGYDISDITNIIERLESHIDFKNNSWAGKFPIHLIREVDNTNLAECSLYIKSLSDKERIGFLGNFFNATTQQYYCVFCVEGIKPIDLEISNDIILRPRNTRVVRIEKVKLSLRGLRLQEPIDKYPYAIILTNAISPKSAMHNANQRLNDFAAMLSLFVQPRLPLRSITNKCAVFDSTGRMVWTYHSSDRQRDKRLIFNESYDLSGRDYILNDLLRPSMVSLSHADSQDYIKIMSAIHWYGKANASDNSTDKLLFHWIAIEHIFNSSGIAASDATGQRKAEKIDVIQKGISSAIFMSEIHDSIWEIYYHFADKVFFSNSGIPDDLITRAKLRGSSEDWIEFEEFYQTLPELIEYEQNENLKQNFHSAHQNLVNAVKHKKKVIEIVDRTKTEVLLLYRFRNMIVHNAKYRSMLLPYYSWKAGKFSGVFIRSFLDELKAANNLKTGFMNILNHIDWYLGELEAGRVHAVEKKAER